MRPNNSLKIKICCIASSHEAGLALDAGADVLGLVSHMPSGPGVIDESIIQEVVQHVAGRAETFLLTSLQDPDAIIEQHQRCGTSAVQLTDSVTGNDYARLRASLPGVQLVQVVHVTDASSVDEAQQVAGQVDAVLLDSGNPNLKVKQLGGTGRRHDWSTSRQIVEALDIPVYLAGGLNPGNAVDAIQAVRPYGLDICSGVRTEGQLDAAKLKDFIHEARQASSS